MLGVPEEALGERPLEDGEDRAEELLRTGEDDLGEVEGGDEGAEGDAEALAAGLDHLVAVGAVERGAQPRQGQPGLEAAALAARAVLATVGADRDVADLPGGVVGPGDPAAAGDDAAADTAPDVDEDHVLAAGEALSSAWVAASESFLTSTGRRGLGDEPRRGTSVQPRLGAVRTVPSRSTRPGCADTDAEHGVGERSRVARDELEHDGRVDPAALGGVHRGGALLAQDHLAGDVEDGGLQAGRNGQVDREGQEAAAVEVDERARLARTSCSAVPMSMTRPSSMSSATRADMVTLVTPTSRASWARLVGPRRRSVWSTRDRFCRRPSVGAPRRRSGRGVEVGLTSVSKLY